MLASDSLAIINGALAVLLALGRHRKKLDPAVEEHLQNRLASLAQVYFAAIHCTLLRYPAPAGTKTGLWCWGKVVKM